MIFQDLRDRQEPLLTEINRKVWFSVSLPACLGDSNNLKTNDRDIEDGAVASCRCS